MKHLLIIIFLFLQLNYACIAISTSAIWLNNNVKTSRCVVTKPSSIISNTSESTFTSEPKTHKTTSSKFNFGSTIAAAIFFIIAIILGLYVAIVPCNNSFIEPCNAAVYAIAFFSFLAAVALGIASLRQFLKFKLKK
jgi:Flp pilus assembly protein TadB